VSASIEVLPKPLASFLRELPGAGLADLMEPMADALVAIDDEGNDVADAAAVIAVLTRIAAMPWSFLDRLTAMADVAHQRGHVTVHVSRSGVHVEQRRN
jgi:hypothetical protein